MLLSNHFGNLMMIIHNFAMVIFQNSVDDSHQIEMDDVVFLLHHLHHQNDVQLLEVEG